jgi:hypothetical protein
MTNNSHTLSTIYNLEHDRAKTQLIQVLKHNEGIVHIPTDNMRVQYNNSGSVTTNECCNSDFSLHII